jgi:hypothetical protein
MADFDLLSAVQPSEGWFVVVGLRNGLKDVKQTFVATREEVDSLAATWVSQKRNVFFGLAKFNANTTRTKGNVKMLKAFWLDIDCGKDKAKVDPVTGRPKGYIDQAAGFRALREFCQLIKLPKPIIVNSGRGLHVYWALETEVSRAEWEPVGLRLRDLCKLHNFYVDPAIFEVARILRIPGTLNFKADPPIPVAVLSTAPAVEFEKFRSLLGAEDLPVEPPKVKREMTALGKSMLGNVESSFKKIMVRSANGTGCQQLLSCFQDRATLDEPRWFDALSIAKFCSDRDTAIHKLSEGHPDYDYAVVEKKAQGIKGPHSCAEFEAKNPGGCEGCPHWGKITNPLALGRDITRAAVEDNVVEIEVETPAGEVAVETHQIPAYPFPFFRGKTGGVYMQADSDEEAPKLVYEHDLYVVKRMRDPGLGEVVVLKVHMPKDGVQEFIVPYTSVTDRGELRKALSRVGIVGGDANFNLLGRYIVASIKELQQTKKVEHMRLQFGWADKDSKFIVGDREITKDGVYHSPPSSITATIAQALTPKGTLSAWKEVFNLFGRPGLEAQAFGALTAFGAPLLKFLGQNGAIINLIHSDSGTGKTTVLHMCNSVFGNPQKLCAMWDDTLNAKIMRLGIMNNIAFCADELTNTTPQDFSTLAYSMTQGRGKDRLKASANVLRDNATTWQTLSLCSSNASFYEKMTSLKATPDGEMMRLLEYSIEFADVIDPAYAKQMFDHQLKENYGHAGDIYVQWLLANLEEAVQRVRELQVKIDKELGLTQRERFWSAVLAVNIMGGIFAKRLGLLDWDMKAIYQWATKMLLGLRLEVAPKTTNIGSVVGDFVNRHIGYNTLVVDDGVDLRTNLQSMPKWQPRGPLIIRYEPDTKYMYIAAKPFKDDCVDRQINYRDTLKELGKQGIYVNTVTKRMSKGMAVSSPGVHCLMLNCTDTDFIDVSQFAPAEASDASGTS